MTGLADLRRLLRERDLAYLLGAQFTAQAADGAAHAVFADVLILEPLEQGTPGRILAVFALTLLPYSLISPFLGVFVDRWSRRALLSWTNVARALLLASLPAWRSAVSGDLPLYAAVLVLLGLGRLFLTTKGAVLPVVLHERELVKGNAISGGGGMIAALAGGVAGISLVAAAGTAAAFVTAGAAYAIAAGLARALGSPMTRRDPVEVGRRIARITYELIEGLRAIWARPRVRWPLGGIFVLRVVAMFVAIAAILIIKNQFPSVEARGGKLAASAVALASAGAGALLGALAAPLLARRLRKPGLIVLGFVISGAALLALGGFVESAPPAGAVTAPPAGAGAVPMAPPAGAGALFPVFALTFVGGFGGFLAKVAVDALVQEELPDVYRGRAFALYDILYNAASVVAAALMVASSPPPFALPLTLAGVVTLALAVAVGAGMRRVGLFITTASAPRA